MSAATWDQVLAAVQAGAHLLPPPFNTAAAAATALARGLMAAGCSVEGCDVELLAPRAPDLRGEALADEIELDRIATGTDRHAVEARLRGAGPIATANEEDLLTRYAKDFDAIDDGDTDEGGGSAA